MPQGHALIRNAASVGGLVAPAEALRDFDENLVSGYAHAFHSAVAYYETGVAAGLGNARQLRKTLGEVGIELPHLRRALGAF